MTNSDLPGGADEPPIDPCASSQTNLPSAEEQQFATLLSGARALRDELKPNAHLFYQRAASHAQEWLLHDKAIAALRELGDLYMQLGDYSAARRTWRNLADIVTRLYGPAAEQLALINMQIGLCHAQVHQLDEAIQHVREAVVRYQSASTDDRDAMAQGLCTLAGIYRLKNLFDRAKTCIRQAYEIYPDNNTPALLQIRLLEELATINLAQNRPAAALDIYHSVLTLKQEVFGTTSNELPDTLIKVGMCHAAMHLHAEATDVFIRTVELLRLIDCRDRNTLGGTLLKLAGCYRSQGRFMEAEFMEMAGNDVIGRANELRLGYVKPFDAGVAAQRRGHLDVASASFRKALCDLEATFDKQAAQRIPVLGCLLEIAELRGNKGQSRSLQIEIEESVNDLFRYFQLPPHLGLLRLAQLFRLAGHDNVAETCYRLCQRFTRKKGADLLPILQEHASLLERMHLPDDVKRVTKMARRLNRKRQSLANLPIVVQSDESS